jgi:hypothetical protein
MKISDPASIANRKLNRKRLTSRNKELRKELGKRQRLRKKFAP